MVDRYVLASGPAHSNLALVLITNNGNCIILRNLPLYHSDTSYILNF